MTQKKYDVAELYKMVYEAAGRRTIAEMAREVGLKQHLLTHYVLEHAVENGLPEPTFVFSRPKTDFLKIFKRSHKDRDYRISTLQLQMLGLDNELRGKFIGSSEAKAGLFASENTLQAEGFVDALVEIAKRLSSEEQAEIAKRLGSGPTEDDEDNSLTPKALEKVRPLRLPQPSSKKSKSISKTS